MMHMFSSILNQDIVPRNPIKVKSNTIEFSSIERLHKCYKYINDSTKYEKQITFEF